MWVTYKKSRNETYFLLKFSDQEDLEAYLQTLKACEKNIPSEYNVDNYKRIICKVEMRVRKSERDEEAEFESFLYASEIATFLTLLSPILLAAECFSDLPSEEIKRLFCV